VRRAAWARQAPWFGWRAGATILETEQSVVVDVFSSVVYSATIATSAQVLQSHEARSGRGEKPETMRVRSSGQRWTKRRPSRAFSQSKQGGTRPRCGKFCPLGGPAPAAPRRDSGPLRCAARRRVGQLQQPAAPYGLELRWPTGLALFEQLAAVAVSSSLGILVRTAPTGVEVSSCAAGAPPRLAGVGAARPGRAQVAGFARDGTAS